MRGLRNVFYAAAIVLVYVQMRPHSFVLSVAWLYKALFPCLALATGFAIFIYKSELAANSRKLLLPWVKKLPSEHIGIFGNTVGAFLAVAYILLFGVPYTLGVLVSSPVKIEAVAQKVTCSAKYGNYACITLDSLMGSPPLRHFPDFPQESGPIPVVISGKGTELGFFVNSVSPRR